MTSAPTVTGVGTQINGTDYLVGGTRGHSYGGQGGFENEFILLPNTNYLIRMTNDSGSTIKMNTSLYGYHPNI
jgi:hypothetical protein